ncbi:MAG: hypothetical protein IPO23_12420 [Flavobacterium sp.]|nr:hypothetical protein [Flavobacterium sp.]
MSGLTPGTLYYVRAYATNAIGTSYGTQTTFTTLAPPTPTAISSGSTSIDLNWTRWTGDRAGASTTYNVMVVRSSDATFTQPTNGVGYAVSSTNRWRCSNLSQQLLFSPRYSINSRYNCLLCFLF